MNKKDINILFVHNAIPDYRIPWFVELNKLANCEFLFTNVKIGESTYGVKTEYERLSEISYNVLSHGIKGYIELFKLLKYIDKYDFVELPPIDSLGEFLKSVMIYSVAKLHKKTVGYFWEKWEAPREYQPLKRKIKNWILKKVGSILFLRVDVIFSPGRKNAEYFINAGVEENKIHKIPDVSETPKCGKIDVRKKHNISSNKKVILYFGRITEEKGLDILLSSFSQIKDKNSSVLLVAGDGVAYQRCVNLASQLNIREYVIFVGKVHPDFRADYFEACDVFVFPCTYRNGTVDVWGLTVNEAIQHKKVVITTEAVGSAYELIENGVNGVVVKPESVEKLVEAIDIVLSGKMNKVAEEKNNELLLKYNYSNMALEYIKIVMEYINYRKERI